MSIFVCNEPISYSNPRNPDEGIKAINPVPCFAFGPIGKHFWCYFRHVEKLNQKKALDCVIKTILQIRYNIPYSSKLHYENSDQLIHQMESCTAGSIPPWIKMEVMFSCITAIDKGNNKVFLIAFRALNLSTKQQYKCLKILKKIVFWQHHFKTLSPCVKVAGLHKDTLQILEDKLSRPTTPSFRGTLIQYWDSHSTPSEERLEALFYELENGNKEVILNRVRFWKTLGLNTQDAESFVCEAFYTLDIAILADISNQLNEFAFTPSMLIALFEKLVNESPYIFSNIPLASLRELGCEDAELHKLFRNVVNLREADDFPLSADWIQQWNLPQKFIDQALLDCSALPHEDVEEITTKYLSPEGLIAFKAVQEDPDSLFQLLACLTRLDQSLIFRASWQFWISEVSEEMLIYALQLNIPLWLKDKLLYQFSPSDIPNSFQCLLPIVLQSVPNERAVEFCWDYLNPFNKVKLELLLTSLKDTDILFDFCWKLTFFSDSFETLIKQMPLFNLSSEQYYLLWDNIIQNADFETLDADFYSSLHKFSFPSDQLYNLFKMAILKVKNDQHDNLIRIAWRTSLKEEERIRLLNVILCNSARSGLSLVSRLTIFSTKELEQIYLNAARIGNIDFWNFYPHLQLICNNHSPSFHLQFLVAIFSESSNFTLTSKDVKILWSYPQFDALRGKALELLLWMPRFNTRLIPLLQSSDESSEIPSFSS